MHPATLQRLKRVYELVDLEVPPRSKRARLGYEVIFTTKDPQRCADPSSSGFYSANLVLPAPQKTQETTQPPLRRRPRGPDFRITAAIKHYKPPKALPAPEIKTVRFEVSPAKAATEVPASAKVEPPKLVGAPMGAKPDVLVDPKSKSPKPFSAKPDVPAFSFGSSSSKDTPLALGNETKEAKPFSFGNETKEAKPFSLGNETKDAKPFSFGNETKEAKPFSFGNETKEAKPFSFGSKPAFGDTKPSQPFSLGAPAQPQAQPQAQPFDAKRALEKPSFNFGATSTPAFGANSTPLFGANSGTPTIGAGPAPFGANSNTFGGTPSSTPFGANSNTFGAATSGAAAFGTTPGNPLAGGTGNPLAGGTGNPLAGGTGINGRKMMPVRRRIPK